MDASRISICGIESAVECFRYVCPICIWRCYDKMHQRIFFNKNDLQCSYKKSLGKYFILVELEYRYYYYALMDFMFHVVQFDMCYLKVINTRVTMRQLS